MANDLDKKIVAENVLKVIDEITSGGGSSKGNSENKKVSPCKLRNSTNNNVNIVQNVGGVFFKETADKSNNELSKIKVMSESFKPVEGFQSINKGFNFNSFSKTSNYIANSN